MAEEHEDFDEKVEQLYNILKAMQEIELDQEQSEIEIIYAKFGKEIETDINFIIFEKIKSFQFDE